MEYLRIIFSSIFSLTALFFLTKITGKRQMSQLSVFDYVNGITIGSIAAEMATELENSVLYPLTAMVIYSLSDVLLSYISDKNMKVRSFIEGKPSVLFENGSFDYKLLKRTQYDISEIFAECRVQGYFDFSDVQTIIAEHNGKLSILPKVTKRPVNTDDLKLSPTQEFPSVIAVYQGIPMTENLRKCGKNQEWLMKQLDKQKTDIHDVFIATATMDGTLNVFKDINKQKFNIG